VERAVQVWLDRDGQLSRDYCPYNEEDLLKDARDVASGRRDLKDFREAATPITARDFDWLDLLVTHVVDCKGAEMAVQLQTIMLDRQVSRAAKEVLRLCRVLAVRAAACGVPIRRVLVKDPEANPGALFHAAQDLAVSARLLQDRFHDPVWTDRAIAQLEDALHELAELRSGRFLQDVEGLAVRGRKAALKRILLDALGYLSRWGRDVGAFSPGMLRRFRLTRTTARKRRRPAAATTPPPG
jgi:hypothetical protein